MSNLDDLALSPLVLPPDDQDLVVFPDRHGSALQVNSQIRFPHRCSNCRMGCNTRSCSLIREMVRTECFDLRSLLKGEDMIFRLIPEGAPKWAFLDFRRSVARPEKMGVVSDHDPQSTCTFGQKCRDREARRMEGERGGGAMEIKVPSRSVLVGWTGYLVRAQP